MFRRCSVNIRYVYISCHSNDLSVCLMVRDIKELLSLWKERTGKMGQFHSWGASDNNKKGQMYYSKPYRVTNCLFVVHKGWMTHQWVQSRLKFGRKETKFCRKSKDLFYRVGHPLSWMQRWNLLRKEKISSQFRMVASYVGQGWWCRHQDKPECYRRFT